MRRFVVILTILLFISWDGVEALQLRPKRLAQDQPKEEPIPVTANNKKEPEKKDVSKINQAKENVENAFNNAKDN